MTDSQEETVNCYIHLFFVQFAHPFYQMCTFDTAFTEKTDRVMLEQDRDIRSVQDTFLHDFGCTQIRFADNQIHLFCQAGQIKCFFTSRITTAYNSHHFLTIEKTVASRTSRNTHSGIFLLVRQS